MCLWIRCLLINALVVKLENPVRFEVGVIEKFSYADDVCQVILECKETQVCPLDSIMILSEKDGREKTSDPLASQEHTSHSNMAPPSLEDLPQHQQDRLVTVLLVKDLLKRKEQILQALTKMNDIERGNRKLRLEGEMEDATMKTAFQRQYAWLVVNLDVTNHYLKAALLRLEDTSSEV